MNKFVENTRQFYTRYRFDIACVGVLLLIAGLLRLTGLGTFLTADEKNWIGRSYEFVRAFRDWRFNDMLQTTHPGVTTLWLVGAAVAVKTFLSHIPFSFHNLINFVWSSQLAVALANTACIPFMYLFLRRLIRPAWWAFLATLLIVLDPFLVGYSRVVHVDALLANFLFLSCMALIIYVQEQYSRRWLIISSVCFALAVLTKIPAVFAIPFFFLAVFAQKPDFWRHATFMKDRARDFLLWLLLASLIFLIIWPALLWVPNPQGNALTVKRDVVSALITPHNMTEDYSLNPWLYPAALLTRTTPVVLVLSLLFVGSIIWQAGKNKSLKNVPIFYLLLVAYVGFFVLMMTLGAKKGDRYILPVFPAISVLTCLSLQQIKKKYIAYGLVVIVIVSLVYTNIKYFPYAISYSDPLLPDNLSQELGWGEGLEQVATWLNTNHPNAVVASWYPDELGAFTSARVAHINAHEQVNVQYVVLYRNMFGRAPDHPANNFIDEYYKKKIPVFVARIAGKEFAWVYEKRVYTQVVGELVPGATIGQSASVLNNSLAGVDILFATYTGRAKDGVVHVQLKNEGNGELVHEWLMSVRELKDDLYTTFLLPEPINIKDKKVVIEVSAEGTKPGDAPTIRSTLKMSYRPDQITGAIGGNLGVRLRYVINGQQVTEEDTKLLLSKE